MASAVLLRGRGDRLLEPAFSFSQIRGTAKNQVGRTSGMYSITSRASGQQVIVNPQSIGR